MKLEKTLSIKKAIKIVEQFLKDGGLITGIEKLNEIEYYGIPSTPYITARRLTISTHPALSKTNKKHLKKKVTK